MRVVATVSYESDSAQEAFERVAEWVLTPGAEVTVMWGHVEPQPPIVTMQVLTEEPFEADEDGKIRLPSHSVDAVQVQVDG